jgi:protein-S-isoprenylcysteine O-methyltransferase Ste14
MGWDGSHPFLIKLASFTILVAIWQGSPLLMGFVALFMCICPKDLKTSILVIKHVMSNALLNQCNLLSLLPQ